MQPKASQKSCPTEGPGGSVMSFHQQHEHLNHITLFVSMVLKRLVGGHTINRQKVFYQTKMPNSCRVQFLKCFSLLCFCKWPKNINIFEFRNVGQTNKITLGSLDLLWIVSLFPGILSTNQWTWSTDLSKMKIIIGWSPKSVDGTVQGSECLFVVIVSFRFVVHPTLDCKTP